MTEFAIGQTKAWVITCTDGDGELYDPDIVQASFVKDHSLDPSESKTEDTLNYGGSEPRDNQLTRRAEGVYDVWYTLDVVGQWSVLMRWRDETDVPGVYKTIAPQGDTVFSVVATEHQFIDREAMIPPGGGEPVSVPYATDSTGGMLTDLMAVKFAGIPSDAQSASQVSAIAANVATGMIASSHVLGWYLANWSVGDWYLDAVNGSDANDGITAGTALATVEELSRRLAVAVPIAHPVTVHIAQGTYGTLAVSVIQTAVACPFDVVGTPVLTPLGTVGAYTVRVGATSTESLLTVTGVADWTPYVGRTVRITDGASSGSLAQIGKVNPHGLGVATAGITRFCAYPTGAYPGTATVPAAGSAISLVTLPTLDFVSLVVHAPEPIASPNLLTTRLWSLQNIRVLKDVRTKGHGLVEGCDVGQLVPGSREATSALVPRMIRSIIRGVQYGASARYAHVYHQNIDYCLFLGATNVYLEFGAITSSLFYGATIQPYMSSSVLDSGIFDSTSASGAVNNTGTNLSVTLTSDWGRDNAGYGLSSRGLCVSKVSGTTLTGALGDIYLDTAPTAVLPWSALPYVDGEQTFEATLVAPGTGHTAEATSYVDVTVRQMPVATQKMQAGYKTFAGTTGSLRMVYIDATTVRIVSSSATDTSIVTGHILPTGDNVVIRS